MSSKNINEIKVNKSETLGNSLISLRKVLDEWKYGILSILFPPEIYQTKHVEILKYLIKEKNLQCIYISCTRPINVLINLFKENDLPLEKLFIIDVITKYRPEKMERKNIIFLQSPENLIDLCISLSSVLDIVNPEDRFVLIDSVNSLLIYNTKDSVLKLCHTISIRLREKMFKGVFLAMSEGLHADVITELSFICERTFKIGTG